MNYTNREVVRRLKQYDMFMNSLNLTTDEAQIERICDQLDKIEKQILLETNTEYEEQYLLLLGEETRFFDEEKSRLHRLISLILDRRKYLDDRKYKHKDVTGSLVELTTFLGEDKLASYKRRLEIIEKYEENKVRQENLIREMKSLDVKLSEASRIVKANTRLNDILENKMREIVSSSLDKFNLYSLVNKREEILKGYETLEYAFELAKGNLKVARDVGEENAILECDEMLSEIATDYSKYNEKVNILKLIDIYDDTVSGYDELLEKREKINEILRCIADSELYNVIADELNKQYNSIKLQRQDIDHYQSLKAEREIKHKTLYDIEEENNSKEFKSVIDELVKNENRVREEQIRKAKKEEYQQRQKKLLEEQKIEASRVRRQKLIEEARLKEQQARLEKVKELQEKTVINPKTEEKVNTLKEENKDKTINPVNNNSSVEVVSFSNDFDTDELFENTKIVPNRVVSEEKSILDSAQNNIMESAIEDPKLDVMDENIDTDIEPIVPVWEEPSNEEVIDLFKEEPKVEEVVMKEEVVEVPESIIKETKPSIYDILENNQNIIWKATDNDINKNTIPVIGNNNLKPEVLDSKVVNSQTFPKLENRKEGEILWKETL